MQVSQTLLCAFWGAFVSWWLVRCIIDATALRNVSSSRGETHQNPKGGIGRFGGVGLAGAFLAVSVTSMLFFWNGPMPHQTHWVILLGGLSMFAVGFSDDLSPIRPRLKLLWQIGIATCVFLLGTGIEVIRVPFGTTEYQLSFLSGPVTVLWLVGMTNLINLIDGIDGLAAGVGLMLMCLLSFVGLNAASDFPSLVASGMAGALLGFLWHNFPPAKIYMGDGGAYLIGFLIGLLSLVNSQKGTVVAALVVPVIALAVPIADTTWAIVRRWAKGLPIFRPDQNHFHHLLIKSGFSRRRAVLTLYGLTLLFSLLGLASVALAGRTFGLVFGLVVFGLLVSVWWRGYATSWFSIRSYLENPKHIREQIRYTLVLSKWFQLEAARCDSLPALWENFQFLCKKLGFRQAILCQDDQEPLSFPTSTRSSASGLLQHRISLADNAVLEFFVEPSNMAHGVFEQLCDLAAEAWVKGLHQWDARLKDTVGGERDGFGNTIVRMPARSDSDREDDSVHPLA